MKLVQYAILLMLGAVVCRLFGLDGAAQIFSAAAGVLFGTFLILFIISVMRQRKL